MIQEEACNKAGDCLSDEGRDYTHILYRGAWVKCPLPLLTPDSHYFRRWEVAPCISTIHMGFLESTAPDFGLALVAVWRVNQLSGSSLCVSVSLFVRLKYK